MLTTDSDSLKSGYAYRSTKRHPKEPETVVVVDSELSNYRFVGYARIDGSTMNCFRSQSGKPHYLFQL